MKNILYTAIILLIGITATGCEKMEELTGIEFGTALKMRGNNPNNMWVDVITNARYSNPHIGSVPPHESVELNLGDGNDYRQDGNKDEYNVILTLQKRGEGGKAIAISKPREFKKVKPTSVLVVNFGDFQWQ